MSNNTFRAPQKKLQSSFPNVITLRSKTGGRVIKYSLSRNSKPIIKDRGNMIGSSSANSNIY